MKTEESPAPDTLSPNTTSSDATQRRPDTQSGGGWRRRHGQRHCRSRSLGIPVVLLDIPGDASDRNAPARNGLQRAIKSKPASFMHPDRAALVTIGNTEDNLELLSDCDWVVEAIIELPEPKRALFARFEKTLRPRRDHRQQHLGHSNVRVARRTKRRFCQEIPWLSLFQSPALHAFAGADSHASNGAGSARQHARVQRADAWQGDRDHERCARFYCEPTWPLWRGRNVAAPTRARPQHR